MDEKYQKFIQIFVQKPEGKRSLGISNHIWEDNIKMNLRDTEWKDVDWIHFAQNRDQWWCSCAVTF
jgi:hypothetical protein